MTSREDYSPGAADAARIEKNGDDWTLVLVKDLRHPPQKVWQAITSPEHLSEWAPYDADRNMGEVGPVKLSTVGTPYVTESEVIRADAPHVLEYRWGDQQNRWQLESTEQGTRLTLWAKIDRRYIAMGAAGWHLCLDVLGLHLDGTPIGRIVANDALEFEGWQRLHKEYAQQFAAGESE